MDLRERIRAIPYIRKIQALSQKYRTRVYLVGGFLRDLFLQEEKEILDFDFAVEKNVLKFSYAFGKITSSKVVILDRVLRNIRVAVRKKNKFLNFDFSAFRGRDIRGDLENRDFTVNTLCVEITPSFKNIKLLDYLSARKDLRRRLIRVVSEKSFLQDPLRILRAFSLSALYHFKIDKDTLDLIFQDKHLLRKVSLERISEELFKIFSSESCFPIIRLMDEAGVLEEIIPPIKKARGVLQGAYHHLDVWEHSLETLKALERLLKTKRLISNRDLVDYLNQELAWRRKRIQLLKLACLLHDIGKPRAKRKKNRRTIFYGHERIGQEMVEKISGRLKLSSSEKDFLKKAVYFHLRPGYLVDKAKPSPRAIYRFFRDTQEEGVSILILAIADWRATRGVLTEEKERKKQEKVIFRLIEDYFSKKKEKPLVKLIDGYDVMRILKLSPSPLVGEILKEVREAQSLGEVSSRAEALRFIRERYEEVRS